MIDKKLLKYIFIIGPPLAGKTTQSQFLKLKYDQYKVIGIGNLMRKFKKKFPKDEIAKRIDELFSTGALSSLELKKKMFNDKRFLNNISLSKDSLIFDGFPRTDHDISSLNNIITFNSTNSKIVIFDFKYDEIIKWRTNRLICRECFFVYQKEELTSYFKSYFSNKDQTKLSCLWCDLKTLELEDSKKINDDAPWLYQRKDDQDENLSKLWYDVYLKETCKYQESFIKSSSIPTLTIKDDTHTMLDIFNKIEAFINPKDDVLSTKDKLSTPDQDVSTSKTSNINKENIKKK